MRWFFAFRVPCSLLVLCLSLRFVFFTFRVLRRGWSFAFRVALVLCLSCSSCSLPFVRRCFAFPFVFFAVGLAFRVLALCVFDLCSSFPAILLCLARFRFFAFRTLPVLCLRFRSFAFRTLSVLLCLSHTLSVLCLSYAFGSLRFARFRFFTFRTLSGFLPFAELEYFEVTCFFVTEARIRADPGSRVYWTRHPALTRDPGPGIREFRVRLGSRVRGGGPGNVMAADPGSGTPDPGIVMARTRDSGTPDPEFVMAKNERTRDPGSGSPQSKPQYRLM